MKDKEETKRAATLEVPVFEVLTFDGNATLGFVNARSEKHAQRVADRLFCISKKRERVCKCLVKKVES